MTKDDLGPMPEPQINPGEPNPGGVDAISGEDVNLDGEPLIPNLPPELNPGTVDAVPDEIVQGEDTSTQVTDDEEPMSGEQESPA